MKIAICTNFYSPAIGGGEEVSRRISEYLARNNTVKVFTRQLNDREHRNVNGVEISEYNPLIPNSFLKSITKFSPDYVLIYSDVFDFFIQTLQLKIKTIICMCGGNRVEKRDEQKRLLENMDCVKHIVIHSEKEQCYNLLNDLGLKATIIPNGIDLSEFSVNPSKSDLLSKYKDYFWILNISNFFPGKNQNLCFEIIKRIPECKNSLYIQIAANSSFNICKQNKVLWDVAQAKYSKLGIKSVLKQGIGRKETVEFLKCSNAFLFTSEKEVGPLVILEAMAAEIPWVSADVGEVPLLPSGGFVVSTPKNDKKCVIFDERVLDKMAEKLSYAIKNPTAGFDGQNFIKGRDWSNILPYYERLFFNEH